MSGPRAGEGGASGGDGGGSLGGAPTEGGQGGWAGEGGGKDGPPLGNLLVNPSFEQGLVGWSVDPPSAVVSRYVYTQYPTGGKLAKDGTQELATWDETDEYSLYIYQTVTGLVPGVYSFSGFFSSQQSRGAHLFARNCGGAEQQEVIPTVSLDWFEIGIPEVMVSGTSCEVGFFVHGVAQDWLNADMFTFERVP